MTVQTLNAFERTIETTHAWLNDLMERLGWDDNQRAYIAMRGVLHALRDRLSVDDASHLAAQLPMLVRGFYYEGHHPAGKPLADRKKAEFLAHVAAECPDENEDGGHVTQAVFEVLANRISPGETEKIKGALPAEIRALWP